MKHFYHSMVLGKKTKIIKKLFFLLKILFISLFLFNSCNKKICCDLPPDCCIIPSEIFVKVTSKNGNDLLDQSKSYAYKIDDVRAFHFYDNREYYLSGSNEESKLGKFQNDNFTHYKITLSYKLIDNKSRTIIKWNATNLDTIDAFIASEKKKIDKIIVNSKEIIDLGKNTDNMLQIHLIK